METGQVQAPAAPGPESSWAAAGVPTASLRRRNFKDRLARWVVCAGGFAIVASVLGILAFIVYKVIPLFVGASASAHPAVTRPAGSRVVAGGVDEYETLGFVVSAEGRVEYLKLGEQPAPPPVALAGAAGRRLTCGVEGAMGEFALGTSDGSILSFAHRFLLTYDSSKTQGRPRRIIAPELNEGAIVALDERGQALVAVARQSDAGTSVSAGVTSDGRLLYHLAVEKKSMLGKAERSESRRDLTAQLPGPPTAVAVDAAMEFLIAGTRTGRLAVFALGDPAEPQLLETPSVGPAAVTHLSLLLGQRSIAVGDAAGRVEVWCDVEAQETDRGRTFKAIHRFPAQPFPSTAMAPSHRERGFAVGDSSGRIVLRHSTSEQELLTLQGEASPVTWVLVSPRSTAIYAAHENGIVRRWSVHNPHPEITFNTLFAPVWYEGLPHADWKWQAVGGTDAYEPKLSLFPLMVGTFKGTLFALLIAVPLSVLGALYTAQFMHPVLRSWVKPTVEIMAALPSVVLGFIAALWLAPTLESLVPAILLMFIVLPLSCLAALAIFRLMPESLRHSHGEKLPVFFLIPALLAAAWLCVQLNGPFESLFFGGSFSGWVRNSLGLRFDSHNALIVGIAMGFAVIPIVFTITEDALSNVPRHLTSGSLALGATPWQTAVRVVLPAALPGVFSAIMIGLGRAVGETMIVLMATGGTATLDWYNPFTGFRTLSANIATEIPEAAQDGTLYRTLFLGALLLFIATFIVNTAAEIVRQRMRRRYAQL